MLTFDPVEHRYEWNGCVVPSITQVLRSVLGDPFLHVHPAALEYARQRGTAVHKACELDDAGQLDERSVAPEIAGYVRAWREFRRAFPFKVIASERPLYSSANGYAGTPDRIVAAFGFRAVVEIKTGLPGIFADLQTAAQAILAQENYSGSIEFGVPPLRRFVMHIKANGTPHLDECTSQSDWRDFLSALNVYRLKERIG